MGKGLKIFLGVVAAIVVASIIIYFVAKNKAKKAEEKAAGQSGQKQPAPPAHTGVNLNYTSTIGTIYNGLPDGNFPLKKGSKSRLVYLFQHYLNTVFGHNLTLDGNWGTLTDNAAMESLKFKVITKDVAKQLIEQTASAYGSYFTEYNDLIKSKITG